MKSPQSENNDNTNIEIYVHIILNYVVSVPSARFAITIKKKIL